MKSSLQNSKSEKIRKLCLGKENPMKSKLLLFAVLALILAASACSPLVATGNPGEQPTSPPTGTFQVSYIGLDGNVWFYPGLGGAPRQITTDAFTDQSNESRGVAYYFPRLSSDGEWVAYRRDFTQVAETGMQYTSGLFLFNLRTNESLQVLKEIPAGFDWKPGTHVLAYGVAVPEGYFGGGENPVDETLARGLQAFDADTSKTQDLVQPERGYALYNPQWSSNGRLLGFDELTYMEGRGKFAYYDFKAERYIAWDETIGNYVFNSNGSQIIYDRLSYVANGTEDVFARPLQGGREQPLTHYDGDTEYALSPALSPSGDWIAYLANMDGTDNQSYTLFIQELDRGEPLALGKFEMALNLEWSSDGEWLVFSTGPWDAQQVVAVNVADRSTIVIGAGTMPGVNR
jgi:WD40 repeat protein